MAVLLPREMTNDEILNDEVRMTNVGAGEDDFDLTIRASSFVILSSLGISVIWHLIAVLLVAETRGSLAA